jgi:hypothetical protein
VTEDAVDRRDALARFLTVHETARLLIRRDVLLDWLDQKGAPSPKEW